VLSRNCSKCRREREQKERATTSEVLGVCTLKQTTEKMGECGRAQYKQKQRNDLLHSPNAIRTIRGEKRERKRERERETQEKGWRGTARVGPCSPPPPYTCAAYEKPVCRRPRSMSTHKRLTERRKRGGGDSTPHPSQSAVRGVQRRCRPA
jgi:hypothetical protein